MEPDMIVERESIKRAIFYDLQNNVFPITTMSGGNADISVKVRVGRMNLEPTETSTTVTVLYTGALILSVPVMMSVSGVLGILMAIGGLTIPVAGYGTQLKCESSISLEIYSRSGKKIVGYDGAAQIIRWYGIFDEAYKSCAEEVLRIAMERIKKELMKNERAIKLLNKRK